MMSELAENIVDILVTNTEGCTWRQLQLLLRKQGIDAHHGQISGALTGLHKDNRVFYLLTTVDGSHPYVHSAHKARYSPELRVDNPKTTKWREVADQLYLAMTDVDTTDVQWDKALDHYRKVLNDN